jgi:peptidoglycan/xylan/chitin deacetylase (PgdA/CDA1 family)
VDRRVFGRVALGGAVGASGAAGWLLHRPHLSSAALEAVDEAAPSSGRTGPFGTRRFIYSVKTNERVLGLTFDDGPDPQFTPRVLAILRKLNIRATFNVMGYNALRHSDLLKQVVAHGHEVGNHTWSHLDLSTLDADQTGDEIRRGRSTIEAVTGQRVRYFRPPRGEINGVALSILAEESNDLLLWSVTGSIPGEERADTVNAFVLSNLAPGAILDYHDGIGRGTFDRSSAMARDLIARRTAEVDGLEAMLRTGMKRGYTFVTISELLTHETGPTGHTPARTVGDSTTGD